MSLYKQYSEKYLPAKIEVLLIGESPPVEISNFIYNQADEGKHMLLANIIYSFFNEKLEKNKRAYLNQLKDFGIFLIDSVKEEPINSIKNKKLRGAKIVENYPALKAEIPYLPIYDSTVFLLLHSNVCDFIGEKLRQDFYPRNNSVF